MIGRLLGGTVGILLLLWGLSGMLDVEGRLGQLQAWGARRRAPRQPEERDPNTGRPPHRNLLFRDRESELEQLARNKRLGLSGLGGVGKTQLAIEYLVAFSIRIDVR